MKIFHNEGHEYFSKHIIIHLIFSYIGLFSIASIVIIFEVIIRKNNCIICSFNLLEYYWIGLISIIWIVEDYFFIFYSLILGGLEFWFLELLIVSYLNSKMLYGPIEKYQKLAMIINIFPLILKFVSVVLSTKVQKETSNLIYIKHIWIIPVGIVIYFCINLIILLENRWSKIFKSPNLV